MPESLRERYLKRGFLRVRQVFDAEAIARARRQVADVPVWIRRQRDDRNVQRAQPLQTCPAIRDRAWLRDFYDRSSLDRVVTGIFAGAIEPTPSMANDFKLTALLIEPLDRWWATGLHRDYRDFIEDLDVQAWRSRTDDLRLFNQINIPLLEDDCLWAVPGSHRREDTTAEARLVAARARYARLAEVDAAPDRVRRRRDELFAALTACGAVNVRLDPGDLLLYRSNMLHCGIYEPGVERLTIHDGVYSAQWRDFVLALNRGGARRP